MTRDIKDRLAKLEHNAQAAFRDDAGPMLRIPSAPVSLPGNTRIITAKVNELLHVVETDTTFDVDGIAAVVGSSPGATLAGVFNTYEEHLFDDSDVLLLYNETESRWQVLRSYSPKWLQATVNEALHVKENVLTFATDAVVGVEYPTTITTLTGVSNNREEFFFDDAPVILRRDRAAKEWHVEWNATATRLFAKVNGDSVESVDLIDLDGVRGTGDNGGFCTVTTWASARKRPGEWLCDNADVHLVRDKFLQYWVVDYTNSANEIRCTCDSATDSGDSTFAVSSVVGVDGFIGVTTLAAVSNKYLEHIFNGSTLYLKRDGDDEKWVIDRSNSAKRFSGTANTAVATTDATYSVAGIAAINGYYPTPGTLLTGVENTFSWAIAIGKKVELEIKDDGTMRTIQAECA